MKVLPKIAQKVSTKKFFSYFFLTILFFIFPLTCQAIETQILSAYPSHPNDSDPRSKSWFIYSLPGGETRKDSVTLINNGNSPLAVKIYAVDSTTTKEGGFALLNEDSQKSSIGSWIKLDNYEINLASKEKRVIPFIISIPNNAKPGEYSGGIIIQESNPKKILNKGMGINVISRIGVRIYETVPGENQLNLKVENFKYSVVNNNLNFHFELNNKGTVHISPRGTLTVKDITGNKLGVINLEKELDIVIPGKPLSVNIPTQIKAPLFGWGTADLAIYYSPTKAATASVIYLPNPWTAFVLIFLAVIIIVYFVFKKFIYKVKGKDHHIVLSPHVKIIVGSILIGTILFSGLIAYLLNLFLGKN